MEHRYLLVAEETVRLLNLGLIVYSPIVHCHEIAKRFSLPTAFEFWKNYNFGMLEKADQLWVYTVPGWATSLGVRAEINQAVEWNKTILFGDDCGEDYQYC